jgi:hypothetical protein
MVRGIIKKILLENERGLDYRSDDIFPKNLYQRIFKIFDSNPDKVFEVLRDIELRSDDDFENYEKEYNIVYKYLTEHENRVPFYIDFTLDSEDLSNLFYDDRDYSIRKMVKDYFDGEYEYEHDYDCFDVDSWLISKIDSDNMKTLKEKYIEGNLGDEGSEEDFMEFIEEEYGSEIGCAAGSAQYESDINYLHSDFINGVEDYLSNFSGKLITTNSGFEYRGSVEIGDLVNSENFGEILDDYLSSGYPSSFMDIFYDIKGREIDAYYASNNYFFPEDLIRINTDKHFRYGSAGDIDWAYFNEVLSDRLNY